MTENIIDEILRIRDVLPKKQQKLCSYLVMNCDQVSIMTVAELAQAAEVGTTTVMRLIQTLGRSSFAEFKKDLLNAALMQSATSYRCLKQSFQHDSMRTEGGTLQNVATDGLNALENLCTPSNIKQFDRIADILEGAERIFLLGLRSSKALALYCEYGLSTFYPHVYQLSNDTEYIFDRIALYPQETDAMLVFSIWPCTRKTIEAAEVCYKKGIPVVLITNTSLNPIVKYAAAVIDTNSVNHPSGQTVIMAVIEAIISELGRRKAPVSSENIEAVEGILSEKSIVLKEY